MWESSHSAVERQCNFCSKRRGDHPFSLLSVAHIEPCFPEIGYPAWAERIKREYYSDDELEDDRPLPPVTHCKTVSYRPGYPMSYHDVKVPRSGKWGNASPRKVREYQKGLTLLEKAKENVDRLFRDKTIAD